MKDILQQLRDSDEEIYRVPELSELQDGIPTLSGKFLPGLLCDFHTPYVSNQDEQTNFNNTSNGSVTNTEVTTSYDRTIIKEYVPSYAKYPINTFIDWLWAQSYTDGEFVFMAAHAIVYTYYLSENVFNSSFEKDRIHGLWKSNSTLIEMYAGQNISMQILNMLALVVNALKGYIFVDNNMTYVKIDPSICLFTPSPSDKINAKLNDNDTDDNDNSNEGYVLLDDQDPQFNILTMLHNKCTVGRVDEQIPFGKEIYAGKISTTLGELRKGNVIKHCEGIDISKIELSPYNNIAIKINVNSSTDKTITYATTTNFASSYYMCSDLTKPTCNCVDNTERISYIDITDYKVIPDITFDSEALLDIYNNRTDTVRIGELFEEGIPNVMNFIPYQSDNIIKPYYKILSENLSVDQNRKVYLANLWKLSIDHPIESESGDDGLIQLASDLISEGYSNNSSYHNFSIRYLSHFAPILNNSPVTVKLYDDGDSNKIKAFKFVSLIMYISDCEDTYFSGHKCYRNPVTTGHSAIVNGTSRINPVLDTILGQLNINRGYLSAGYGFPNLLGYTFMGPLTSIYIPNVNETKIQQLGNSSTEFKRYWNNYTNHGLFIPPFQIFGNNLDSPELMNYCENPITWMPVLIWYLRMRSYDYIQNLNISEHQNSLAWYLSILKPATLNIVNSDRTLNTSRIRTNLGSTYIRNINDKLNEFKNTTVEEMIDIIRCAFNIGVPIDITYTDEEIASLKIWWNKFFTTRL